MNLADRWAQTWADLAIDVPDGHVLRTLLDSYREPHRGYHTLRHLDECFEQFDTVRTLCTYPGEVQLALWFHDAIYDTRAADNEDRSASWAETVLSTAGADAAETQRVRELVLTTNQANLACIEMIRISPSEEPAETE